MKLRLQTTYYAGRAYTRMPPSNASSASPRSVGPARIDALRTAIAPLRDELLNHPIYTAVNTLPRLRGDVPVTVEI